MVDAAMSFRSHRSDAAQPAAGVRKTAQISASVSSLSAENLAAYAALSAVGCAGPAQSAAWVGSWVAHANPDGLLAVLRSGGKPVYALALETSRHGPFVIARFMSGRHANGNFPVADPAFLAAATAADIEPLLAAIRLTRPDIDLLTLERLLPDLDGLPNPLFGLPHFISPNVALAVDLKGGFQALMSRANGKRKGKKHRGQMRKFEAAGGFRRIEASTRAETSRLLDAFFAMKEARFRKMGIADVFSAPEVRSFLHELFAGAAGLPQPPFVLHGIEVAGKLRAVTGSSRCGRRIICEFGAIVEDELSNASPGDFLFYDNIEEACAQGLAIYDFSVGDEPYKRTWCDIETRHFDVVLPLTTKGRVLALALRLQARAKTFIKGSPTVWKIVKLVRRRAAGKAETGED